jgi:hypothetical protein
MPRAHLPKKFETARPYWTTHRETSLNWIALGLLLAAWNASDDDASDSRQRPESLRGYSQVSVRAAIGHSAKLRTTSVSAKGHKSVNDL